MNNEQKLREKWKQEWDTYDFEVALSCGARDLAFNYWLKVISDERARLVEEIEKMKFKWDLPVDDMSYDRTDIEKEKNEVLNRIIHLIKNNE